MSKGGAKFDTSDSATAELVKQLVQLGIQMDEGGFFAQLIEIGNYYSRLVRLGVWGQVWPIIFRA